MEELGLAAQMGQESPAGMGPGTKMDPMVALNEVVEMLRQGATPEELISIGIPAEVVEVALDILAKEAQQGQMQDGLAAMQMDPRSLGM
jgi:hypothetical protein